MPCFLTVFQTDFLKNFNWISEFVSKQISEGICGHILERISEQINNNIFYQILHKNKFWCKIRTKQVNTNTIAAKAKAKTKAGKSFLVNEKEKEHIQSCTQPIYIVFQNVTKHWASSFTTWKNSCFWHFLALNSYHYQVRGAAARSAGFSRIKKIPYQAPPTQLGPQKCTF